MPQASIEIVSREGSRLACVRLNGALSPKTESWFMEYLQNADGVAYMEFDQKTRRLAGYGVLEPWWEGFRLWLGVSIMQYSEKMEECDG